MQPSLPLTYKNALPPFALSMTGHVSKEKKKVIYVQAVRRYEKGNGTEERQGITFIKWLA